MSDLPNHEQIDKTVAEIPGELIARLPDSTEKRSAQRHLGMAAQYAHEAAERARAKALRDEG